MDWPNLTGEQFALTARRAGWVMLLIGDRYYATRASGAVQVRLRFGPETQLSSWDVEAWADKLGIPNHLFQS